jgi:hypothetical protein
MRDALLDALHSETAEDSDVYFTLYGLERTAAKGAAVRPGAPPTEVASAFVNFETMLRDEPDLAVSGAVRVLPLSRTTRSGTREVGELVLRVEALRALRAADGALRTHGGAATAKKADKQLLARKQRSLSQRRSRASAAPERARGAGEEIEVAIHELVLHHVGELEPGVDELEFEFDFLALDHIRSGPVPVELDGSHVVAFDKRTPPPAYARAARFSARGRAVRGRASECGRGARAVWAKGRRAPLLNAPSVSALVRPPIHPSVRPSVLFPLLNAPSVSALVRPARDDLCSARTVTAAPCVSLLRHATRSPCAVRRPLPFPPIRPPIHPSVRPSCFHSSRLRRVGGLQGARAADGGARVGLARGLGRLLHALGDRQGRG